MTVADLPDAVRAEVLRLSSGDNPISALVFLRTALGLGLCDAWDLANAIREAAGLARMGNRFDRVLHGPVVDGEGRVVLADANAPCVTIIARVKPVRP